GASAPPLREAYQVVVEPRGTLLVADGGRGAGRIVRVDPRTGRRTLVAGDGGTRFAGAGGPATRAALGRVTDVALGPDGSIWAIASTRLVRIRGDGRLRVVHRFAAALGVAVDARGAVWVTDDEGGRLLRLAPGSARPTVVASGFSQPIGVAATRDGVFVSSGHEGGRVERVAADGTRTAVVGGLALAAFVTDAGDGSLLVVDHVRHGALGRILRVADGRVTTVSEGAARSLSSAAQGPDGTIYATAFGPPTLGRIDRATGRLVPLGRAR
ncbi:MAG: hypothetical protein ACM33B_14970, partial [Pseudomonadota bacterium]